MCDISCVSHTLVVDVKGCVCIGGSHAPRAVQKLGTEQDVDFFPATSGYDRIVRHTSMSHTMTCQLL